MLRLLKTLLAAASHVYTTEECPITSKTSRSFLSQLCTRRDTGVRRADGAVVEPNAGADGSVFCLLRDAGGQSGGEQLGVARSKGGRLRLGCCVVDGDKRKSATVDGRHDCHALDLLRRWWGIRGLVSCRGWEAEKDKGLAGGMCRTAGRAKPNWEWLG